MIGILAVLIAILVPTLSKARASATKLRCAATLRELVAATTLHHNQAGKFPEPRLMPGVGAAMPASVQAGLLNDVLVALKREPIVQAALPLTQMPHPLVCPVRAEREIFQTSEAPFGTPFWQTGYMYVGGLEQQPNAGQIVIERRHADLRGKRRGVLWADTLAVSRAGGTLIGYGFYHAGAGWKFDANTKVSRDHAALLGQHRGYSDGSVEWVPAHDIRLDAPASPVAYRVTIGGMFSVEYVY